MLFIAGANDVTFDKSNINVFNSSLNNSNLTPILDLIANKHFFSEAMKHL